MRKGTFLDPELKFDRFEFDGEPLEDEDVERAKAERIKK